MSKKFLLDNYPFSTKNEIRGLLLYWFIANILSYLLLIYQRDDFRLWKIFAERTCIYYIMNKLSILLKAIKKYITTIIVDTYVKYRDKWSPPKAEKSDKSDTIPHTVETTDKEIEMENKK
jgi:hypothetical protein